MADKKNLPRGGHGGSAEIIGGKGIAVGGKGGRGGAPGHGSGGDAGGGKHTHTGSGTVYVRGGDGGDAGRPGRPTLGAASPLSAEDLLRFPVPGLTDIYGIPQPGKGGDSGIASIDHCGRSYSLNILLRLLNGPVPAMINKPQILDVVDELFAERGARTPQEWWNLAVEKFPAESSTAILHMKYSEDQAAH